MCLCQWRVLSNEQASILTPLRTNQRLICSMSKCHTELVLYKTVIITFANIVFNWDAHVEA